MGGGGEEVQEIEAPGFELQRLASLLHVLFRNDFKTQKNGIYKCGLSSTFFKATFW